MYKQLVKIDELPSLYEYYTAETLWNDPHTPKKMLEFHLNPDVEPASRKHAFIEKSVDWICSRINIGEGVKIADFGCGPGLYATRFAERGASVTGIDFSERSIAYAKEQAEKKGLSINYIYENYLNFSSNETFDVITMIYCDFCALSDSQRKTLLNVFHRHLKEGGFLIVDVFSLKAFHDRKETSLFARQLLDGFWSENDYYGFLKTVKYEKEHVILDKYTIIEPSKQFEVFNWLAYYSKARLGHEFSENGFEITEFYSDVSGRPFSDASETIAVIARKRTNFTQHK